jgi:hypothetical protein
MKVLIKRDILVNGAPVELAKRAEKGVLTGVVVRGNLVGERVLFKEVDVEIEREFENCVWVGEKELLAIVE